jgi:hypothetical protein
VVTSAPYNNIHTYSLSLDVLLLTVCIDTTKKVFLQAHRVEARKDIDVSAQFCATTTKTSGDNKQMRKGEQVSARKLAQINEMKTERGGGG